ncbi:MAG: TFIIB-type zinc ribbon-containing protein [Acidimicrobiales bacterium]
MSSTPGQVEVAALDCPSCEGHLASSLYHHITVEECQRCHGIWFDKDELRKAKDNTDPDLRWLDFEVFHGEDKFVPDEGERRCPKCSGPMHALRYMNSGVRLDVCPADHGVWLDQGGFERIIAYLEEVVVEMDSHDYERAAVSQLRDIVTGPESRIAEVRDFLALFRLLEMRLGIEHPKVADAVTRLSGLGL